MPRAAPAYSHSPPLPPGLVPIGMLTLHAFGQCLIDVDGVPVTPDSERPFACLLYLAMSGGRPVRRRALAALLWPDLSPAGSRHALRQLLYRLRRAGVPVDGGVDWARLDARACALAASACTVTSLREALGTDAWPGGGWLPGYAPTFSGAFADWVEGQRATIEVRLRTGLAELLASDAIRATPGHVQEVAETLQRLLATRDDVVHAVGQRGAGPRPLPALRAQDVASPARPSVRTEPDPGAPTAGLVEALATLRGGAGLSVRVRGPVGIGRSHQLRALATWARSAGAASVLVPGATGTRRSTLADLARELVALPGALGCAPAALVVMRALVRGAGSIAPGGSLRRRAAGAIAELVAAVCCEGPVVLCLDDVDAMIPDDRSALADLPALARTMPLLLVVGERTPGRITGAPDALAVALRRHSVQVDLAPVDDATARAIALRAAAGARAGGLHADEVRWCVESGGGVPAVIVACAQACAGTPRTRSVPSSVRAHYGAVLDGLTADARVLLLACAAADAALPVDVLADALRLRHRSLVPSVAALEQVVGVSLHGGRLRISAPVLAATILQETSPGARAHLEGVVGSALLRVLRMTRGAGDHPTAPPDEELLTTALRLRLASGGAAALEAAARMLSDAAPTTRTAHECARVAETARVVLREDTRARATAAGHTLDAQLRAQATRWWCRAGRLDRAHFREPTRRGHAPSAPAADEERLAALELRWHAARLPDALPRESQRIASDASAEPGTRLRAALLAIAAAELEGDDGGTDLIRQAIEECAAGQRRWYLHARMAHEISFGSMADGAETAWRLQALLDAAVGEDDPAMRQGVGEAFRACGHHDAAAAAFNEAYRAAIRRGEAALARRAALRCAAVALDRGRASEASRWVGCVPDPGELTGRWGWLRMEEGDLRARVLAHGAAHHDRERALQLTVNWRRGLDRAPARLARARVTTAAEARTAAGAPIGPALTQALWETHRRMSRRTLHDRTALALAHALLESGRQTAAAEVAGRYLARERRALGHAPALLVQLASAWTSDG